MMQRYRFFLLNLFAAGAMASDWQTLYGDKIDFGVYRDDRRVGTYETVFVRQQQGWQVISRMDISVPLFLFISWDYAYKAREVWQNQWLKKLDVFESRNGSESTFKAQTEGPGRYLKGLGQEGTVNVQLPVLPTSHYNAEVIHGDRVLNTLTGQVNRYRLTPVQKEMVTTNKGQIEAQRYRYEGELNNTEVWYSDQGHWVKLWFKGDDGSNIELRCLYCMK